MSDIDHLAFRLREALAMDGLRVSVRQSNELESGGLLIVSLRFSDEPVPAYKGGVSEKEDVTYALRSFGIHFQDVHPENDYNLSEPWYNKNVQEVAKNSGGEIEFTIESETLSGLIDQHLNRLKIKSQEAAAQELIEKRYTTTQNVLTDYAKALGHDISGHTHPIVHTRFDGRVVHFHTGNTGDTRLLSAGDEVIEQLSIRLLERGVMNHRPVHSQSQFNSEIYDGLTIRNVPIVKAVEAVYLLTKDDRMLGIIEEIQASYQTSAGKAI